MKHQERSLADPSQYPTQSDFGATIQYNLEQLYQHAHGHDMRATAPVAAEGNVGDIVPVEDAEGNTELWIKFSTGWKSVALT